MEWFSDLFGSSSPPKKGRLDSENPPRINNKKYPIPPRPPNPPPSANTPRPICPACVACMLRHEQKEREESQRN